MIVIRNAGVADLPKITEIYNHEIQSGISNYAEELQTVEFRMKWFQDLTNRNYPILVADIEGIVVGFLALTPFHPLGGYRFTVSGSIYIAPEYRSQGIGKLLLERMRVEAEARKYHSVVAGVNSQNKASIALLKGAGFKEVGHFKEIGFKNGQFFDDVCLQLMV